MIRILIRTSTQEQSPENQLSDCQSINTYGEAQIIKEQQSAWSDKDRPLMIQLKKDISHKKVKHLITWDLDRLFRKRKKLIEFFKFCKVYDCQIHSFRQTWLEELNKIPAPFDEIMHSLMLQIMGWIGEEESQKKSDRVKIAYANHHGKKWGRPATHTNKKKVVYNLREQGNSIRQIAKITKLSVGKVSEICSER